MSWSFMAVVGVLPRIWKLSSNYTVYSTQLNKNGDNGLLSDTKSNNSLVESTIGPPTGQSTNQDIMPKPNDNRIKTVKKKSLDE